MSAKVSRHIRKQRRARRRALKQQPGDLEHTQPRTAVDAEPSAHAAAGQPHGLAAGTTDSSSPAASSRSSAARITAVLAGCGVIVVAGGSAAFHMLTTDQPEPLRTPTNYVAAPAVTERLVCPPTPGTPDSLSDDGVLEYEERDESVQTAHTSLLFASSAGASPAADWFPITEEGPGEPSQLSEESIDQQPSASLLAQRDLMLTELEATQTPAVLQIRPLEDVTPDEAATAATSFTYLAEEGPQSGLISAQCPPPQRSQWFLGPATGSGASSLLTLTNPHDRDATVEVTTFSAEGATGSLGETTVLVPAESVRTVNLAALTEDPAQLAVHVQASGAPVAGHLQSSYATGGSGQGTDLLPGISEADTEHHMLAVPGGEEQRPQLWIHTPGDEGGTVELQVFDEEGQAAIETPGVFSVEAGQVSVVDIEGLEAGTYSVMVRTDEPTVAAVRSSGDGEPITVETELPAQLDPITGLPLEPETAEEETSPEPDISWAEPAQTLRPGFGTLLPPTGQTQLQLLGQGQVSYRLVDSTGETSEDLSAEVSAGAAEALSHQQLQDQAQEAGLESLDALVVTEVTGQIRAGVLTREDQGYFSIGALESISPSAQYVPLRFER